MICDPKYNFSLGQKYLVVASFKVCIFHQIQPMHKSTLIALICMLQIKYEYEKRLHESINV